MRIAHFAPFTPHSCGLYESTRDMVRAERLAGHTVELVDSGGVDGKRQVGAVDERGDCKIVARDFPEVLDFDLFAVNGNIPMWFLAQTRAPVIHFIHGRPLSSFRLQQQQADIAPVYDLHFGHARNPRVKFLITLWPEHLPYWRLVAPNGKLQAIAFPPCDLDLFTPTGPKHEYVETEHKPRNILVADLWRDDVDPYDVTHGIIELARKRQDFHAHFLSCKKPLGPWEYLFRELRRLGALGETAGQMLGMPERYRAADVVVTPHHIATRIVRESLASGCSLVAHRLCQYTQYRADIERPESVAEQLDKALNDRTANRDAAIQRSRQSAERFGLGAFAKAVLPLYEQAVAG